MFLISVCMWAAFAAALLMAAAFGVTEDTSYIVAGVGAGVAGVLFAALDRVIALLTDIRNALTGDSSVAPSDEAAGEEPRVIMETGPDGRLIGRTVR